MRLCRPRFLATLLQRFKFCCVTWDKLFNLSVPHPPDQVRNSHTVGGLCRLIHLRHTSAQHRVSPSTEHTHTHIHIYIPTPSNLYFHFLWSVSHFLSSVIVLSQKKKKKLCYLKPARFPSAFFVPVGFGVFFLIPLLSLLSGMGRR